MLCRLIVACVTIAYNILCMPEPEILLDHN